MIRTITALVVCLLAFSPVALAQNGASKPSSAADSAADSTMARNHSLYSSGIEFGVFLDLAERRKEMWHDNFDEGSVPQDVQTNLDGLHGTYHLLAVAIDGCSDSVNTIPYLAHMVAATDRIDMRIIDSTRGRAIMEENRTPDGRPATPTVLILDESFRTVGVFIERPTELQEWALGEGKEVTSEEFMTHKMGWYDQDRGRMTMTEVLAAISAHEQHNH